MNRHVGSEAEPQTASNELAPILERLYRYRFSSSDLRGLDGVWRVLVSRFFQKRIRPDATVLDLGAGPCLFINYVRAHRRIAVDANPDLARHASPGVEAIVSDDLSLGVVDDASVDHVFLSNFLEHLADHMTVLRVLAAIHRKLRVGGSVLILQPNFGLEPRRYFDSLDHRVILTDVSLVEALHVVGFRVIEVRRRFLPFTSKSRLPKWPWLVAAYLSLPPAQWLLGKQTFVQAVKDPGEVAGRR